MKSIKLIAAAAALTISSVAVAGPSYTYIDGGIVVGQSTGDDSETQGLALRGSFGFANIWHVGADLVGGEVNGGKKDNKATGADATAYALYVGLNPAMTENLDLVVRLGIAGGEEKFLVNGADVKDEYSEIYLQAGPRGMIGEKFEWSVLANIGAGEYETSTKQEKDDFRNVGAQAGAAYYFTPNMSLGLDVGIAGNADRVGVYSREGVADLYFRWSF